MRIFRSILLVISGALLCLLLIYILGNRIDKPAVIAVGPPHSNVTHPILHLGQVLTWERPTNDAFTVGWLNGEGPCKDLLIRSKANASGGQTASCEVVRLPPESVYYSYGIGEGNIQAFDDNGIVNCWGCDYFNGSGMTGSQAATRTTSGELSTSPIRVSCTSSGTSGTVHVGPTPDQIPRNLRLAWTRAPNITIDTPITFTDSASSPANVTCSNTNPLSCDFTNAKNYPITYTLSVKRTSNNPPYCGPDGSGSGSGKGQIDAPTLTP